jgi:hypothetical protein
MKHKNLLSAVPFSMYLLFGCSNNNAATPENKSDSTTSEVNSSDTIYAGNSSLAYTVNGRHVAIKDYFKDKDGKSRGALFINEVKNDPSGKVKITVTNELTYEVFDFSVANEGSTTILHYSPSLSNFHDKTTNAGTYMSPKYKNYYADSVVVKITDINATHVAGTFSGKFLSDDSKPIPLEITDGSFDVVFTKDKRN